MRKAGIAIGMVLFLLIAVSAFPQGKPLVLEMKGNLVVVKTTGGKRVEELAGLPREVANGEIIQYTILGRNTSRGMLRNIQLIGNIPDGTSYIDKSARSSKKTRILFSIDRGKTYAAAPIKEKVKRPDGKVVEQIVAPERYTNIKFIIDRLDPSEEALNTYRVRVK